VSGYVRAIADRSFLFFRSDVTPIINSLKEAVASKQGCSSLNTEKCYPAADLMYMRLIVTPVTLKARQPNA
jgi:hypothetical protein